MSMKKKRKNNPCCGGCSDTNTPKDCSSVSGDCLIFCNIHHEVKVDPCGGTFSVNVFQEGVQHLLGNCEQSEVQLSVYDFTSDFTNVLISGGVVTGLTSDQITDNPEIRILAECDGKQNIFCIRLDIMNLCSNVQCDPSCEECNPCTGQCEEVQIDLLEEELEIKKENC